MRATRTDRRLASRGAAAAALLAACACAERVGDTGYAGTWSLGNERVRSTLSIVETGDGYRVRLGLRTADGKGEVRCGWDGRCDEIFDGARAREWKLGVRRDPESGRLVLTTEMREIGEARASLRSVDELVVEPGGRSLRAWTLERNGQEFATEARPTRVYEKVADRVEDPPR